MALPDRQTDIETGMHTYKHIDMPGYENFLTISEPDHALSTEISDECFQTLSSSIYIVIGTPKITVIPTFVDLESQFNLDSKVSKMDR